MNFAGPLRWVAAAFAAVCIAVALVITFFDWNDLRAPIARKVTRATGRPFAINGDLKVELSLHPLVTANKVTMGNAQWSREPVMASADSLAFRIDLLALFVGKVVLPELTLSQPKVALEVSPGGEANWLLGASASDDSMEMPAIQRLSIDAGAATYVDPRDKTDLAIALKSTGDGSAASGFALELKGKGHFKGQPTTLSAVGGALLHLRNAGDPYPIKARGEVGATRFSIEGMLMDPLHFRGEQLGFQIEGADLAALFPVLGVPMPSSPPYRLSGNLTHTGNLWMFHGFKGTMGHSDMAGDFSVDRGVHPQKIVAEIVSKKLELHDLAGFVGAGPSAAPTARTGKLLPAAPFNLEKLLAADVDARFRGESIVTSTLPLDKMSAHLVVSGGIVKLAPLDFGFAGGHLVSAIEIDARKPRMVTHADITAKGLRLARMFPGSRLGAGDTGTVGGHAQLQGNGNSVAQMLGSANGSAGVIMEGGTVGELALRMSNLDIANSLLLMLGGDQQVPVRCMVGIFNAVEGDFKVDTLVLDTAKVNMTGTGDVNFTDESVHLRLVSRSKGFSLASLRGPIAVTGSFNAPVLKPEVSQAAFRGGLALALGVATGGVGALIPLLDLGRPGDSNCTALMDQARLETGVKAVDMVPATGKK